MGNYIYGKFTGSVMEFAEYHIRNSLGCDQPLTSGRLLQLLRLSAMTKLR